MKILSIEEVISQITEALAELDGVAIEDIANDILDKKVDYQGDSIFTQE